MQSFLGEGSHAKFVKSTTEGIFKDMRAEHKGSKKMGDALDGIEADVMGWVKSRETSMETASKSKDAAKEAGISTTFNRVGSMFTAFFTNQKVKDFAGAKTSRTPLTWRA